MNSEFTRFLLVGGASTAIHYLILVGLFHGFGVNALLASGFGFSISAIFNYLMSRAFTFRSKRGHAQGVPRFIATALMGLGLNSMILWWVSAVLGWYYLFGQIIATVVTLAWNFLINKYWTF